MLGENKGENKSHKAGHNYFFVLRRGSYHMGLKESRTGLFHLDLSSFFFPFWFLGKQTRLCAEVIIIWSVAGQAIKGFPHECAYEKGASPGDHVGLMLRNGLYFKHTCLTVYGDVRKAVNTCWCHVNIIIDIRTETTTIKWTSHGSRCQGTHHICLTQIWWQRLWLFRSLGGSGPRRVPAGTDQDRLTVWLFPKQNPRGRPAVVCEAQSSLEGRKGGEEENMKQGVGGGFYSGKVNPRASGFILKYWLNRRTAYPKKSKSMVENLAWIRAHRPQMKWDARANRLTWT